MNRFAALFTQLDQTNSSNAKRKALQAYFREAPAADAAWAVAILAGRRLKRFIGPSKLREWLVELVDLPLWLVEDSYAHVGDLAETVALLAELPQVSNRLRALEQPVAGENHGQSERQPGNSLMEVTLSEWMDNLLLLRKADDVERAAVVKGWWAAGDYQAVFLMTKILTGSLRVGVSKTTVAKALANEFGLEPGVIQQRLMGDWAPSAENFEALLAPDQGEYAASQPYPFCLAYPLEDAPETLGESSDWVVDWKWDGIRAQIIKREGGVYIWSRGEELIGEQFPEIGDAALALPDGTVLDGELLAWKHDMPLSFNELQRRLGRKKVGKKLLQDVPIYFKGFDILEWQGQDLRALATADRRELLEKALASAKHERLQLSYTLEGSWEELAELRENARQRGVEGLMLKRRDASYKVGRVRGDWWKWKVSPHTVDAVLIYAQAGHGRRSNLYTDYTFAVWQGDQLVPIAKAYSGLTDKEIARLDRWIRRNTQERFGPVRSVTPKHVFELAFEGIALSTRHKSGIAVRFPRILRWREDLGLQDADHLEDIKQLIAQESQSSCVEG